MDRWLAHTSKSGLARVLLGMAPTVAGVLAVAILSEGLTGARLGAASVIVLLGAAVTLWAYRHSSSRLEVTLRGDVLRVGGRGDHRLAPGSLCALRAREAKGGAVMGTYVVVAMPSGKPAVLLIPMIVDDALYLPDRELTADAWFGPEAGALLDRLAPFLAADPAAQGGPPTYRMALRKPPLTGPAVVDALSIVGDSLAFGRDGAVVAEARAHAIAFSPFRFARAQDPTGPSLPSAPGLLVELLHPKVTLTIGAHPMFLDEHWQHLQESGHPQYLVGLGELMRLQKVLEAGRAG